MKSLFIVLACLFCYTCANKDVMLDTIAEVLRGHSIHKRSSVFNIQDGSNLNGNSNAARIFTGNQGNSNSINRPVSQAFEDSCLGSRPVNQNPYPRNCNCNCNICHGNYPNGYPNNGNCCNGNCNCNNGNFGNGNIGNGNFGNGNIGNGNKGNGNHANGNGNGNNANGNGNNANGNGNNANGNGNGNNANGNGNNANGNGNNNVNGNWNFLLGNGNNGSANASSAKSIVKREAPSVILNNRDIVFVLDSSGSISSTHFQKAKRAINLLVEYFCPKKLGHAVTNNGTKQISVVAFSTTVSKEVDFSESSRGLGHIQDKILSINHMRGVTATSDALKFVRTKVLGKGYSRLHNPEVSTDVIVITDGRCNVNCRVLGQEANAIREMGHGVNVFALGIGNVRACELEIISGQGDNNLAFGWQDFNSFEGFALAVKEIALENPKKCA